MQKGHQISWPLCAAGFFFLVAGRNSDWAAGNSHFECIAAGGFSDMVAGLEMIQIELLPRSNSHSVAGLEEISKLL